MKKICLLLLLPICCWSQRQNLLLEATFDGTNPFAGFTLANEQYCCSYSINQVANPQGPGQVIKYDLRSTDPIVSSSLRAEIQLQGTDAPESSERWYGLQYYLQNYGADPGPESIMQWHDIDGSCPPLSLQVAGGRLRITQCIDNGNTHNDLGPVVSNTWFSIVARIKWASTNTGIIQVWRDGQRLVNKSNIRTNSTGGSYFKLGINKWSWAPPLVGSSNQTERIFYIDNFRMGNQNAFYNDVAPVPLVVTPVIWGYFRYNDSVKALEWATETEQNNDHFEVQESDDGANWTTIGSVASKAIDGNSNSTITYSYQL
jgi:hypothetical protein